MSAWRFDPWNLGSDVRLNGIKLLVVAESHYREDDVPDSAFERDVPPLKEISLIPGSIAPP